MCGVTSEIDLAVGPQHEPEHAVRGWMLRAHVDEHLVGADVELDDGLILNGCGGCGHYYSPSQLSSSRNRGSVTDCEDYYSLPVKVVEDRVIAINDFAISRIVVALDDPTEHWKPTQVCDVRSQSLHKPSSRLWVVPGDVIFDFLKISVCSLQPF